MDLKKMSGVYVFDSGVDWPVITIFWWIHWNEIAWVKVIDYLRGELKKWLLKIQKWKLILAYWNEIAIKKWIREVDYNLNRIFKDEFINIDSNSYEIKRVKELSVVLNSSDVLLDIHSVSSDSEPFMFAEDFKDELTVCSNIWPWKIIIWWEKNWWDILSWDTNLYMHRNSKIAFTLECGQHESPDAFDVWLKTSFNLLSYYNLINNKVKSCNTDILEMYKIVCTKKWLFKFAKKYDNFELVNKWDLIWKDWKVDFIADEDFIIMLPNYWKLNPWEEIYYYWRRL